MIAVEFSNEELLEQNQALSEELAQCQVSFLCYSIQCIMRLEQCLVRREAVIFKRNMIINCIVLLL